MRHRLVCFLVLAALSACGEDEPAPGPTGAPAQASLPSEGPPTNIVPEPHMGPIPPDGVDPATLVPPPLTAKQQADIDEANRLAAARSREMASVVIVPPIAAHSSSSRSQ